MIHIHKEQWILQAYIIAKNKISNDIGVDHGFFLYDDTSVFSRNGIRGYYEMATYGTASVPIWQRLVYIQYNLNNI